jgi:serine/threonine-protein kinase
VIHRDLKPANVMVGEFGEVVVLDWGVAKVTADESSTPTHSTSGSNGNTADGVVIGTPGFMAPEQSAGAIGIDGRADVFALGAILRELAGVEKVSAPLHSVIRRATALNQDERYPSVDALAADVRAWLDGAAVSAYSESIWERAVRLYRRNSALILLLLAYLVVRLFVLWWRGV